MEAQLAEAVIFDLWRMQRARNIENEIFAAPPISDSEAAIAA